MSVGLQSGAPADTTTATVVTTSDADTGSSGAVASLSAPHVVAWIITALVIVCVTVLAGLGKPIPDVLYVLGGVSGGTGGALSIPRLTG